MMRNSPADRIEPACDKSLETLRSPPTGKAKIRVDQIDTSYLYESDLGAKRKAPRERDSDSSAPMKRWFRLHDPYLFEARRLYVGRASQ